MKLTQEELDDILDKHYKWLRNKGGGERAKLENLNLSALNLHGAQFRRAILKDVDFISNDLRNTDFSGAELSRVRFHMCDLKFSDFYKAEFTQVNFYGSDLWEADLQKTNLAGVNNLLCNGNGREICSMQVGGCKIGYTSEHLHISGKRLSMNDWYRWKVAGYPAPSDEKPAINPEWVDRNLDLILQLIKNNPATPTGHENA